MCLKIFFSDQFFFSISVFASGHFGSVGDESRRNLVGPDAKDFKRNPRHKLVENETSPYVIGSRWQFELEMRESV